MNWFKKKKKELTETEKEQIESHQAYMKLFHSVYYNSDRHDFTKEKIYLNSQTVCNVNRHNYIGGMNTLNGVKMEIDNDLKDGEYYFSDRDYYAETYAQQESLSRISRRFGLEPQDLGYLINYLKAQIK